ncbi:MAG: DUF4197 domain-containing protein [Alcanivoracaceae bacterium]|nr:DUF4197 domain-containing protein [Alcanivoracaceae bacterium]
MTRLALLPFFALVALLTGCATGGDNPWYGASKQMAKEFGLSESAQASDALKQVLKLSSQRAGTTLSATDGYRNSGYPLTLPASLKPVADTLRKVGMGGYLDKVDAAMNRGAEQAAAEALPVFQQAITNMTIQDAVDVATGGETAATDYFRGQTEAQLRQRFQPIIRSNLEKTGFYSQYKSMLDTYNALPLTSKPNLDIESEVMNQSLNALFGRMAAEEKMIRQAPLSRGSAMINAVLGM